MSEIMGDVLTKKEIDQRGIKVTLGAKGGLELKAPTYDGLIVDVLMDRGFLEHSDYYNGCDYLELKNSVYGFLKAKTIASMFDIGEASCKKSHAQLAYSVAYKFLGKTHHCIIERAMTCKPRDGELDRIASTAAYKLTFDQLDAAMDLAKKAVWEEMQKEVDSSQGVR